MRSNNIKLAIGAAAAFFIMGLASALGSSDIGAGGTLSVILRRALRLPLDSLDAKTAAIVWLLRLPRVLLAFIAGGCLAVSGAVCQSALRNPLASPYILGVSSGASLGAGLVIVSGLSLPLAGAFTLPLAGFIFGLLTVFLVAALASSIDKTFSGTTVILCGMVFSLFVGALLTMLSALFSDNLKRIVLWQMGSFSMRGWLYVKLMLPFFIIGMIGVLRFTRELDILSFGDDEAKAAGVESGAVRKKLLFFAAMLSGAAVALSGVIGFVDLIAPHAARKLIGARHCYLIPFSFLCGGSLMVVTDLIARTVISPSELPIGAITALIGAPFFVWVYFSKRRLG